jgi:hypothetical protein
MKLMKTEKQKFLINDLLYFLNFKVALKKAGGLNL